MNNLNKNIANPKPQNRDRFIGRFDLLVMWLGVGVENENRKRDVN